MNNSFQAGDKVYYLSPLTIGDLRSFGTWVQYKDYHLFQLLKGKFPDELFDMRSRELFNECAKKSATEATYTEMANVLTLDILEGVQEQVILLSGVDKIKAVSDPTTEAKKNEPPLT